MRLLLKQSADAAGHNEYLRDKKQMAFLTRVNAELDYRNPSLTATAGGDRFIEEDTPALYSGVPVKPVPLFPENLGAGGNRTVALLCNPKNVHVGIWRQIRLESFQAADDVRLSPARGEVTTADLAKAPRRSAWKVS